MRALHVEFVATGSPQHVGTGVPPLGLVMHDPQHPRVIEAGDLPAVVRCRRLGRRLVVTGFTSSGFVVRGPSGRRCHAVVYVDPRPGAGERPPEKPPELAQP